MAEQLDQIDKKGEILGLTSHDRAEQKRIQLHLRKIIREEEAKWLQRAKEKELQEGDGNTKYYHAKANGRRRKTTIFRLNQEEGVIEGQNNLKMYITEFYKFFFGKPVATNIGLDGEGMEKNYGRTK